MTDSIIKKASEIVEYAEKLQIFTIEDLEKHFKNDDPKLIGQCLEWLVNSADIDVINNFYFFKNDAHQAKNKNKTVTLYEYHIDVPSLDQDNKDVIFDCRTIDAIDSPRNYFVEENGNGFGPNKQTALSKFEINKLCEIEGRGLYIVLEKDDTKLVLELVNDFLNKKVKEAQENLNNWTRKRKLIIDKIDGEKEPTCLHEFCFHLRENPTSCSISHNIIKVMETDDGAYFEAINGSFGTNNSRFIDKYSIGKIQTDDLSIWLILQDPNLENIKNLITQYFNNEINDMKQEIVRYIGFRDTAVDSLDRYARCVPYVR